MKCPFCNNLNDRVVDSRTLRDGAAIRRRRECLACQRRYTTYEQTQIPLIVLKEDGRREPFSREKLRRGVDIALTKRPVPTEAVDRLISEVEDACQRLENPEVPARLIGQMVMEKLKALDEVAYIRFASVYRRFKDVGEFRRELEKM